MADYGRIILKGNQELTAEIEECLLDYDIEEFDDKKYMDILEAAVHESDTGIQSRGPADIDEEFGVMAAQGNIEGVLELMNRVIDIDCRDKDGNTPLINAVKAGNIEMSQILIKNGADVGAADSNGKTVFEMARETAEKSGGGAIIDAIHIKSKWSTEYGGKEFGKSEKGLIIKTLYILLFVVIAAGALFY